MQLGRNNSSSVVVIQYDDTAQWSRLFSTETFVNNSWVVIWPPGQTSLQNLVIKQPTKLHTATADTLKKIAAAEHMSAVAIRLNVHKMLVFIMQTMLVANKLRLDSHLYVVMDNQQLVEIFRVSMKRSVKVKSIRSVREGAHYWVPGIWDRYAIPSIPCDH